MDLENGLYEHVVMIRRRESDDKKGKFKTKIYNFQGQSERKKRWFGIDHKWLKQNFMTREPDFYKNYIKINVGVIIQKYIKYLEYQLVMRK